jgi:hypothetical protein
LEDEEVKKRKWRGVILTVGDVAPSRSIDNFTVAKLWTV